MCAHYRDEEREGERREKMERERERQGRLVRGIIPLISQRKLIRPQKNASLIEMCTRGQSGFRQPNGERGSDNEAFISQT